MASSIRLRPALLSIPSQVQKKDRLRFLRLTHNLEIATSQFRQKTRNVGTPCSMNWLLRDVTQQAKKQDFDDDHYAIFKARRRARGKRGHHESPIDFIEFYQAITDVSGGGIRD
mmetsp:Transcript_115711/g.182043  ORF Transcript_115711/g.182043 Transcript_115711/m.182043 type:complete len:114 (+) Transcript_115711:583-924(+)